MKIININVQYIEYGNVKTIYYSSLFDIYNNSITIYYLYNIYPLIVERDYLSLLSMHILARKNNYDHL